MQMCDSPGPKCYLVLGMHRSGTSMVTEVLHRCGLSVGPYEELIGAMKSNPRGHWEPRELVALNDRILAEHGLKWDTVTASDVPLKGLSGEIKGLMLSYANRWAARGDHWVWKDPRLCLTAHYWRPLLPLAGVFHVLRGDHAIIKSLAARDGMAHVYAKDLLDAYNRGRHCFDVNLEHPWLVYEEFFDPRGSRDPALTIEMALNPVVPISLEAVRDVIEGVVRPDLKHY